MRLTNTTIRLTFCAAALFMLRGNGCGEAKQGRAPTCSGEQINMVLPPGGCQPLPNVCANSSSVQQTVDFDSREYAIAARWTEPTWATLGTSANRVHLCVAEGTPAQSKIELPMNVRRRTAPASQSKDITIHLTVSDETWFPEIVTWLDPRFRPQPHDRRVTGSDLGLNVKLSGFVANPTYKWSVRRRSIDECSQAIVAPPTTEREAEIVTPKACDAALDPPHSSGPGCVNYEFTMNKLGCFEFSVKVTPAGGGMAKTVSTVATVTKSAVANIIFDPAQFGYMKQNAVLDAAGSSPMNHANFDWNIRVDSSSDPTTPSYSAVDCMFRNGDKTKCIIEVVEWGRYEASLRVTDPRSGESHEKMVVINSL